MTTRISYRWLWLLVLIACHGEPAPARELERRVLAPCCMRQTLEDHDSPIAHQLRLEIEQRVARGETAAVIEDDLVRRYGANIRAMPRGLDPRALLATVIITAIALGALLVAALVRRARRRRPSTRSAPTTPTTPSATREATDAAERYELQLDDELAHVD